MLGMLKQWKKCRELKSYHASQQVLRKEFGLDIHLAQTVGGMREWKTVMA